MGNIDNPRIWSGATVLVAPVGTTAPTDIASSFSGSWYDIGLVGDDGISLANEADTTKHYAFGGQKVRTSKSKFEKQFKFVAIEYGQIVFDLLHPGSTVASAAGITTRTVKRPVPNPKAFAIELVDGDVTRRLIIPKGEVTETGEIKLNDDEMDGVEFTVDCYEGVGNVWFYEITDDPQAVVS